MSSLGQKWLCQLATLGPLGHVRPGPGTIGSLVALGSGYLIASISLGALVAAILCVAVLGIFAADSYQRSTGKKDASGEIVD